MYITKMYKVNEDGFCKITGNPKPESEILEVLDILNAEEGLTLFKGEEVIGNSVWLHDGDVKENYTEKEYKEEL